MSWGGYLKKGAFVFRAEGKSLKCRLSLNSKARKGGEDFFLLVIIINAAGV